MTAEELVARLQMCDPKMTVITDLGEDILSVEIMEARDFNIPGGGTVIVLET